MNAILDAIKKLVKWVGFGGMIAILIFTISGWLFYDLSPNHEQLNRQELSGLFLLSLIIISVFRLLINLLFGNKRD